MPKFDAFKMYLEFVYLLEVSDLMSKEQQKRVNNGLELILALNFVSSNFNVCNSVSRTGSLTFLGSGLTLWTPGCPEAEPRR